MFGQSNPQAESNQHLNVTPEALNLQPQAVLGILRTSFGSVSRRAGRFSPISWVSVRQEFEYLGILLVFLFQQSLIFS